MRRSARVLATITTTLVGGVTAHADGPAPATSSAIDWQASVVGAFNAGKGEGKPLFIAINAERVFGSSEPEPAAKELRDNTYRDPAVVAKSRQFVCTLVSPGGTSSDYAELRLRLGIDGDIVSPQHIFVHSDGTLIQRKEYWSFAAGAASVEALLAMMDTALAAHRAKTRTGAQGASGTPEEQRAAWIRERVQRAREGAMDRVARDIAVQELVHGDQSGDCVNPLCALLFESKKDPDTAVAILRALGKPGLAAAVAATAQLLDDASDAVRSNAAVTLEYIGSAAAIEPLTKRLAKEKDDLTRNNCCRALGRCGRKHEPVRKTLLRELATAKTNKLSAGPAIGLSYLRNDAEAARGIEKILAPGVDWQKRAFMLYALTEIQDAKSADFVRERVLKTEKSKAAYDFLRAVVDVLSGADATGDAQRTVTGGVDEAVSTIGDIGGSARLNRDQKEFTPNGEFAAPIGRGR